MKDSHLLIRIDRFYKVKDSLNSCFYCRIGCGGINKKEH